MWRFIEEGPLLKFPLRESPFMAADPMYRDVVIAPPIRFQRISENPQNYEHASFISSAPSEGSSRSGMGISSGQSSATVGIAAPNTNEKPKSRSSTGMQPSSPISSPSSVC